MRKNEKNALFLSLFLVTGCIFTFTDLFHEGPSLVNIFWRGRDSEKLQLEELKKQKERQLLKKLERDWQSSTRGDSTQPLGKPLRHRDLHPPNLTLINITNFRIPINYDFCNVSEIGLVTIVHTAVQNKLARMIIRSTWGYPSFTNVTTRFKWLLYKRKDTVRSIEQLGTLYQLFTPAWTRLVFLTGQVGDSSLQADLQQEADTYKDIVQGGFIDTYENLSYKNIFGKLWVSQFCEQAEFVVKTDDDMFIDLYGVYAFTSGPYIKDDLLLCPVWQAMKIERNPRGRWYVAYDELTKEEVPGDVYKPYCTGWLYILTPGTAKRFVEISKSIKFLWIDDVWVTGILADALKMKHIDIREYFTMEMDRMILSKSVQNPSIYHRDYLAGPTERNYQAAKTMYEHSKFCYLNKCKNNIYHPEHRVTDNDLLFDDMLNKTFINKLKR